MELKKYNLYEMIATITGDPTPSGSHSLDIDGRLPALKQRIELLNMLYDDIQNIADYRNDYRDSVKTIGQAAYKELLELKMNIEYALDEALTSSQNIKETNELFNTKYLKEIKRFENLSQLEATSLMKEDWKESIPAMFPVVVENELFPGRIEYNYTVIIYEL